ncbi:tryptophan-rich sensory protein [Candidatus Micrarchaeota archaeon]|nr:tryptophan-rich sensory protein [Candidatus Micrarchaeota archaeon]
MRIDWLKLLACFVVCFSAAVIGGFFTSSSIDTWYSGLEKPVFNPPNWVFGPVWTVLYSLMALALYYYWVSKKSKRVGFMVFFAQLVLNAFWSIVFFGLREVWLAFAIILLLEAFILGSIYYFNKTSRKSALLLVPYAFWVGFASVLNYFIGVLN